MSDELARYRDKVTGHHVTLRPSAADPSRYRKLPRLAVDTQGRPLKPKFSKHKPPTHDATPVDAEHPTTED